MIILLLVLLTTWSNISNATTVEVYGYGETSKTALDDAKSQAVSKAVGEYVSYTSSLASEEFKSKIIASSSGIVNSYSILEGYNPILNRVKIRATVTTNSQLPLIHNNSKYSNTVDFEQLAARSESNSNVVDDLFSDTSEIYDVKINSLEVSSSEGNFCYKLDYDLELNRLWRKRYEDVVATIPVYLKERFGEKMLPEVSFEKEGLIDFNNNVEIKIVRDLPFNKFYLGDEIRTDRINIFCTDKSISDFNFRYFLILKNKNKLTKKN